MEEKRFTIEVSERQLLLLKNMSDMMSRLICGQLDFVQEVAEHAWERDHRSEVHPSGVGADGWHEMREQLERHIEALRELCWNKRGGANYGIYYDDTADVLIDIYEVLRKARYDFCLTDGQKELATSCTNMGDTPMHYGKEPLVKVSVVMQNKKI